MKRKVFPEISTELENSIIDRKKLMTMKDIAMESNLSIDHVKHIVDQSNKRVTMDVATKWSLISKIDSNQLTISEAAKQFKVTPRRIKDILKQKPKIGAFISGRKESTPQAKIVTNRRSPTLEIVEKRVYQWLVERNQKFSRISGNLIIDKAKNLYDSFCKQANVELPVFCGSPGWLYGFKERNNLKSFNIHDGSASADTPEIETFQNELSSKINPGGYLPEQIFNVDESGLYWMIFQKSTLAPKELAKQLKVLKNPKNRVTVLLGGNSTGFKLKPFVIGSSEISRCFREELPSIKRKVFRDRDLPVFYRAHKSSWMDSGLFQLWFDEMLVPELRQYFESINVPFKCLLLMDNVPVHKKLVNTNANIEIIYLPLNTTSLIQPMAQSVIQSWKCHFLKRLMKQAIVNTDNNGTIEEYLKKDLNLYQATCLISNAWDDVKPETLVKSFHKLIPPVSQPLQRIANPTAEEVELLVADVEFIGLNAGFQLTKSDITNIINEPEEDATDFTSLDNEELGIILKEYDGIRITKNMPADDESMKVTVEVDPMMIDDETSSISGGSISTTNSVTEEESESSILATKSESARPLILSEFTGQVRKQLDCCRILTSVLGQVLADMKNKTKLI